MIGVGTGRAWLSSASSADYRQPSITRKGVEMKTCTKCKEDKSVTEFHKQGGGRDGLRTNCKACNRIAGAKYYAENTDKCKAANDKYLSVPANIEKRMARRDIYRAIPANYERCNATTAKWNEANPDAKRIVKHNRRARERETDGKLSKGLAERLYALQRGKCACCGKPLGNKYHLDHIMPLKLGGSNTDDNMQLLTATCNLQKNAKHPIDFMQQRGFLL